MSLSQYIAADFGAPVAQLNRTMEPAIVKLLTRDLPAPKKDEDLSKRPPRVANMIHLDAVPDSLARKWADYNADVPEILIQTQPVPITAPMNNFAYDLIQRNPGEMGLRALLHHGTPSLVFGAIGFSQRQWPTPKQTPRMFFWIKTDGWRNNPATLQNIDDPATDEHVLKPMFRALHEVFTHAGAKRVVCWVPSAHHDYEVGVLSRLGFNVIDSTLGLTPDENKMRNYERFNASPDTVLAAIKQRYGTPPAGP